MRAGAIKRGLRWRARFPKDGAIVFTGIVMDLKTNTIAGWALGAAMIALGSAIVGNMIFEGERPEKMGYAIEGVEETGAGGVAEVAIATLLPTADATKGAEVFKKCSACHTIVPGGAAGVGPNLHGVLGKAIAQGSYAYSDALKSVGGTWNFENMDAWLKSPRKFADGTKMTFAGLSNPQDRANILAYLNAQGSNLPLPPPPAVEAPDGDTGGNTAAAVNAVETDVRGETGNIGNTGTPASGAPSLDPEAARKAALNE